jgi:hypothetical protein
LTNQLSSKDLARFFADKGGVVAAPRRIETLYRVRESFWPSASDGFILGYPIWIAAAD